MWRYLDVSLAYVLIPHGEWTGSLSVQSTRVLVQYFLYTGMFYSSYCILWRENEGENDTFNRELRRRGVFVSKCLRGGTDQLDLQEVEILYCNDYVVDYVSWIVVAGIIYRLANFAISLGGFTSKWFPQSPNSVQCFSPRS